MMAQLLCARHERSRLSRLLYGAMSLRLVETRKYRTKWILCVCVAEIALSIQQELSVMSCRSVPVKRMKTHIYTCLTSSTWLASNDWNPAKTCCARGCRLHCFFLLSTWADPPRKRDLVNDGAPPPQQRSTPTAAIQK